MPVSQRTTGLSVNQIVPLSVSVVSQLEIDLTFVTSRSHTFAAHIFLLTLFDYTVFLLLQEIVYAMKVKIKSWTAVGTWQWVSNDDTCGICRMSFEACCPDCRTPGDDCPLVWGECTHCFHIHCIMKWLNSQQQQQQCPMCRQDWKFKE